MMKKQYLLSLVVALVLICSHSLLGLAQSRQTLQSLPNGNYHYQGEYSSELNARKTILIRKRNNTAIGIEIKYPDDNPCIKGTANRNKIVNVTQAITRQTEKYYFSSHDDIDLNDYRRIDFNRSNSNYRRLFRQCLEVF